MSGLIPYEGQLAGKITPTPAEKKAGFDSELFFTEHDRRHAYSIINGVSEQRDNIVDRLSELLIAGDSHQAGYLLNTILELEYQSQYKTDEPSNSIGEETAGPGFGPVEMGPFAISNYEPYESSE